MTFRKDYWHWERLRTVWKNMTVGKTIDDRKDYRLLERQHVAKCILTETSKGMGYMERPALHQEPRRHVRFVIWDERPGVSPKNLLLKPLKWMMLLMKNKRLGTRISLIVRRPFQILSRINTTGLIQDLILNSLHLPLKMIWLLIFRYIVTETQIFLTVRDRNCSESSSPLLMTKSGTI